MKWSQERINAFKSYLEVDETWLRCLEDDLKEQEKNIVSKKITIERYKKEIAEQKKQLVEQGAIL